MTLSKRGQRKANQPLRSDLDLFQEAQENTYSAKNTGGAITLCIAENLLQWEEMREKLRAIATKQEWPDWLAAYSPLAGQPVFREAVAAFVGKHIAGCALRAEGFCASAGATAVVELSAFCLGDPGDVAVFPAPAYQAYTPDIEGKAKLERYDIQRYADDWDGEFHPLSTRELEAAYGEIGDRFRMLVLTQPDNPTGAVYSEEQLVSFADWCEERTIHLIVNEIYALSQFDRDRVPNNAPFTSVLPLLVRRDSPYLHWWYSFSKDFGISGMRVGLLYTHNETFRTAYANYNAPHQVSNMLQWLLSELLVNSEWITAYQSRNQELLTEAYLTVTTALDRIGVPYRHARGSLFAWANFSAFLEGQSADDFWEGLFRDTGVLLTAPGGLGQPEEGWLRIVYSCVNSDALAEAMRRLEERYL
jgi:aspartate/methionine/tyrosine aminotransferase